MSTKTIRTVQRIFKSVLLSLVGAAEQVDQDEYGTSVEMAVQPTQAGQIHQVTLYATEEGTGEIRDSAGTILVFDDDPSVSVGDTNLTPSAHKAIVGTIAVSAGDWVIDSSGGVASELMCCHPVYFNAVNALYFAWKHGDAQSIGGAGRNEVLEMHCWYERCEDTVPS